MLPARELFSYRKYWASRFGTAPFLPMSREEMASAAADNGIDHTRCYATGGTQAYEVGLTDLSAGRNIFCNIEAPPSHSIGGLL